MLILIVAAAIAALLLLITWVKLNASVAITAVGNGLAAGMPLAKMITAIKDGMGTRLDSWPSYSDSVPCSVNGWPNPAGPSESLIR